MSVTITPASAAQRVTIENLYQLYGHDFSEFAANPLSPPYSFGADGRLPDYPFMDQYWQDPACIPLLIHSDGKLAGFALINTHSHRDGGHVERNMAEFFIARQFRRSGVAAEAVRLILAAYPGAWEAAVAERNLPAKRFWPRAISGAENLADFDIVEGDGTHWTGPIYVFRTT